MNSNHMLVLDEKTVGNPTAFTLVADTDDGRHVETMLGTPAECEDLLQRHIDPTDLHGKKPWACAYFNRNDELCVRGNNVVAKRAAVELLLAYIDNGEYLAEILEVTKPRSMHTRPVQKVRRAFMVTPLRRR